MLEYSLKSLTLADFDRLAGLGLGRLLDPSNFLKAYADPASVAKITFHLSTFEGRRPSLQKFLESIRGTDFESMRKRLLSTYRSFFPCRVRREIDAALRNWVKKKIAEREELLAKETATNEASNSVGAIAPSN